MSIEMAVKAAAEQPILLEQETSERRASVPSSELTIVIPAFNEEHAIGQVVEQIKRTCAHTDQEIIVVDDGSTDDTAITAEKAGARVLRHNTNMGYGAALKTAIRNARTAYILTMDSDGQHNAYDIWRLWAVVGDNDMVVGRRKQILHSLLWRMPGKWVLGLMANYLTRRSIPDLNSGFRLIRRDVALKYLHVCPSGFSFSTTITMALLSRGYNVAYIPIDVEKRVGKSTVSISTGIDTIILIMRIASLFNPLRIFIPASMFTGMAGVIWGLPIALAGNGVSVGAMLAIVTALLLFGLGLICDQVSQLRLERFE
jgi:glycosyltransferase involved in cell wall biosynthesis